MTLQRQADGVILREEDHSYTIDGTPAMSVTRIIEEAGLADWTFVQAYYMERGSLAHKAVQFMLESDFDLGSCPDDVVGYVFSAQAFVQAHNGRTECLERRVCSRVHWYAGTLDWFGLLDSCDDSGCCPQKFWDRQFLIDWKTSRVMHPATAIQTLAYGDALYEETGTLYGRRACVLLDIDGGAAKFHVYDNRETQRDREVFRAALLIAKWRKEHKVINLYKRA